MLRHEIRRFLAAALTVSLGISLLNGCAGATSDMAGQSSAEAGIEEDSASDETGKSATGDDKEGVSADSAGNGEEGGLGTGENSYKLPDIGETLHGFTVTERGSIDYLNAQTATFLHEKSGLTLFLIENSDPELAFQIAYRVPQQDEADVPHIFEHSIIAGSDKYPSTNVFFDMYNKSYSTFVNAATAQAFTMYPIASTSEEQLQKMMDVYMSCMEAPAVLKDERIFKREALRYELYEKDAPIEMTGTVFAEDRGIMTNSSRSMTKGIFEELYPDTVASNFNGRLWKNYADLEYSHLKETYDRYYSYDNAIIVLYGKLDYDKELKFLNDNYLGDEEINGKNALSEYDLTPKTGFHKIKTEVPAYRGDSVEGQTMVSYAVDLSAFSDEEQFSLPYLAAFLNMDSSPFKQKLKEKGIFSQAAAECGAFSGFVKPIFLFTIQNAEPSDTEPFYEAVKESLKDVAENGFSKSLVDSVLHGNALNEALSMEGTNIGINNPQSLIAYFMTSGKTDYYEKSKRARDAIYEDTGQEIAKALAQKLLNADTGCLNTVVPTPGLAEKEDEEREKYLSDRKSSMSENEIQKLIDDTLAFNEWNEDPVHNNDFMVDPKDLPDPEKLPEVKEEEIGGISLLSVPADIKGVGAYSLRLNTSAVTEEEINDLNFYIMSFLELGTKEHSREEIAELASYYMSGTAMDTDYPGKEGSKYHYPMLNVSWYAMTEDLKESLNLVMEVLKDTDFSNTGELSELIGKYKESYNPATSDADRTALNLSFAYIDKAGAYSEYVNGPKYYSYLKDLEKRLSSDPGFGEEFAERMRVISEKVTGKKGLIFAMAAEDEELNGLKGIASESLETLSENEIPLSVSYNMGPAPAKKVAVYMDTPVQYAAERYNFADNAEMKGRHFPFITALSDKYIVPFLRFQNGAYSAFFDVNVFMDRALARSYRDPNVSKTMDVFEEIPEKMEEMELTQEDLKGYTARCYGDATTPSGPLSKGMDAVQYYLGGVDLEAAYERVSDIRNASIDDLKAAAEALRKTGQESTFVMSGNRGQMEKDKDAFDLILDYQAEAGK